MYLQLKRATVALFLSLFCFVAYAQQTVTGTVKDATGEPMIGVTVLMDGQTAAITDIDGNFTITNAKPSSVIKVSYIGYNDQELTVGNKNRLDIVMKEDNQSLDEVVVVGYGTMKKSDLTGSVGSVNTEDITSKGSSSVMEALQGSVPGVYITQSGSRAGGDFNIEIRGKSSIDTDQKPLFVVDGVICSDIDFLNEQDIERIDILKDASSTAIYGSRATAGVVMVTTKGGTAVKKGQKPTISYDGYYGFSKVVRMPEFQNAHEFYNYRFLKFQTFAGGFANATSSQPAYQLGQQAMEQALLLKESAVHNNDFLLKEMLANGEEYDWPSYVTQTGSQQNHYLSVNGSTESVNYHFGVGYQENKGIYIGDKEKKISFKGSLDAVINKYVNAGFTVNLARIEHDYSSDDAIQQAFRMNPFMSPYDAEGNLVLTPGTAGNLGTDSYQFTSQNNAICIFNNEVKNRETWRALGNVYVEIKPFKGLNFKTTFSPNYTYYRQGLFIGTETGNDKNSATKITQRQFDWTWDNVLTYDTTIKDIHHINAMGLFSLNSGNTEYQKLAYNGVLDGTNWWNLQSGTDVYDAENSKNSYSESSLISYAFRLNYTLMDRYMATATVRWDGSSRFAEGHRWGSFPSFALAWRLSEENFIKNNFSWINNLKLRLSYGVTGNNSIGNYDTMVTVANTGFYPFGGTYYSMAYPSGIVNKDIQWEKSHEFNVGLDFSFLKNRISGSIDWYTKKSKDLLYDVLLPLEVGGVQMRTNVGSVRNRGIELSLTTVNVTNKDWHWETTFTFAHNKNEVREINGIENQILSSSVYTGSLFVGQPFNNVYSYEWDGIVNDKMMTVPNNEAAINNGFTPGESVRACDYYYKVYGLVEGNPIIKDQDGNGIIDNDDKIVYRADPVWTGSFNTSLTYKGWDFGMNIYAKVNYKVHSAFMGQYADYSDRGRTRVNLDYYIPAGTLIDCDGMNEDGTFINPVYQEYTKYGEYPFPTFAGANNGLGTPYWNGAGNAGAVVDASYVKVKNITLGYTFPKAWTSKFGCQKLRLYCTVTNPFVFTGYKGFDPEWANASLKNDGPSTVTWQFGANIKF